MREIKKSEKTGYYLANVQEIPTEVQPNTLNQS